MYRNLELEASAAQISLDLKLGYCPHTLQQFDSLHRAIIGIFP